MEKINCTTCKKRISQGSAKFKCPKCGEYEIIRCKNCREKAAKYVCPSCGFTGPN